MRLKFFPIKLDHYTLYIGTGSYLTKVEGVLNKELPINY